MISFSDYIKHVEEPPPQPPFVPPLPEVQERIIQICSKGDYNIYGLSNFGNLYIFQDKWKQIAGALTK